MNEIKFKQKIETLKFNDKGLIPCVVQDHASKEILMLAWGSKDTLVQTFLSGLATYWSRSRKEIWVKGKTKIPHTSQRNKLFSFLQISYSQTFFLVLTSD